MNSQIEETEDEYDARIAELRLKEIDAHPELLITGDELRKRLDAWEDEGV